jgi:PTH1 family peptidyl-tRNA hydrolase
VKAAYLIVGLGNIGPDYDHTRHNIGFDVVDRYCEQNKGSWELGRHALLAPVQFRGKKILLIKPTTFMNLSGKAYQYWMKELKLTPEKVMVVTDDIALSLGQLRMRPKGSHAGHNGLRNIMDTLGNAQFPRLRFGVGDDFPKGRQVEYVLGKWKSSEEKEVEDAIIKSTLALDAWILRGIDRAMNEFN